MLRTSGTTNTSTSTTTSTSPTTSTTRHAGLLIALLAVLAGFMIGYVNQRWFFAAEFHSDAAAMQVLAQAMVDEHSLLPTDFGYGNQLIMFRSSPFIALALAGGAGGYQAYIVGSALSVAFWLLVLYAVLAMVTAHRIQALMVSVMLVIPMSVWDYDYVLGQQSHLSNIVMAACAVMATLGYCMQQRRSCLALAALFILLMSAEAPIRALLVIIPLGLAVMLYFGKKATLRVVGLMLLALIAGMAANKALTLSRPLGLNLLSSMQFRTTQEIIQTLQTISLEMLGAISSLNLFTTKVFKPGRFLAYLACLTYLATVCGFAAWRALALAGRARDRLRSVPAAPGMPVALGMPHFDFPGAVAILSVITGALAVAILNPDTARHVIWAGALLKLSLWLALYHYGSQYFKSRAVLMAALAAAVLLPSFWTATLARHSSRTAQVLAAHIAPPINAQIAQYAAQLGINRIFGGDFWRMMTLNSTVAGMSAGNLTLDGDNTLHPNYWLSRKSIFDAGTDVLYYLKGNPVDQQIEARLRAGGGRTLFELGSESIWVGKPVWRNPVSRYTWNGCQLATQVGTPVGPKVAAPSAPCAMQTTSASPPGYLTFGPYVVLEPGKYRFAVDYSSAAPDRATVGKWDVVLTRGGKITVLDSGAIRGTQARGARLQGIFSVDHGEAAPSMELRTLSHGGSVLQIHRLQIDKYVCDLCGRTAMGAP